MRHGGALKLSFPAWAFWHSAYNTRAALTAQPHVQAALNQAGLRFSDWLERMPLRPGQTQLALLPPYEKWALEIFTRPRLRTGSARAWTGGRRAWCCR